MIKKQKHVKKTKLDNQMYKIAKSRFSKFIFHFFFGFLESTRFLHSTSFASLVKFKVVYYLLEMEDARDYYNPETKILYIYRRYKNIFIFSYRLYKLVHSDRRPLELTWTYI